MNLIATLIVATAEGPHRDDNGQIVTHHWLWPERPELIYGSAATIIITYLLFRFAGPAITRGFNARTDRIQENLDAAATAKAEADAEAEQIRQAKGDIDAERQRLFAESDAQAEALLADGRNRLAQQVAELEARAEADLLSASGRVSEELHAEISRIASSAIDLVLDGGIDDATHQALVEGFIQKVGAS